MILSVFAGLLIPRGLSGQTCGVISLIIAYCFNGFWTMYMEQATKSCFIFEPLNYPVLVRLLLKTGRQEIFTSHLQSEFQ